MSNPNLFTSKDVVGSAVISGNRTFTDRPFAKLAIAGAFIFAAAAIAPTAQANGWTQQNTSGRVYESQSALTSQNVQSGEIVGIRPVMVRIKQQQQRSNSYAGPAIGGLIGAVLGRQMTRNSNGAARTLGIAVGGIGGAALGRSVSNHMGQRDPEVRQELQIFVRMNDRSGRTVAVVQDNDQAGIQVGAQVQLVHSRDGLAVTPMNIGQSQNNEGRYQNEDRYQNNDRSRYDRDNDGRDNDGVQETIRSNRYRP